LATWNVRTLCDNDNNNRPERATALVARELGRYNVDIAALSETRLPDNGQLVEQGAGYTFYWQGRPASEARQSGVGFAIRNKIAKSLESLPKGINDRLMCLRLRLKFNRFVTIVSAYAPTMSNDDDVKEQFYHDLDTVITNTLTTDKLIILGDFNARVGRNHTIWRNVIGRHGLGNENSNGTLLLSECAKQKLAITNTFFRLPAKKRTSWMHPRSKQWHLIDYVIVRQQDLKDIKITEAMRGADCWTDHRMIRCKVSLQLQPQHRKTAPKPPRRLNTNCLRNPAKCKELSDNINNALTNLGPPNTDNDINKEWELLRDVVYKTSFDTLGAAKRKHQDWFDDNDEEIQHLLKKKQQLFEESLMPGASSDIHTAYKEYRHEVQARLRSMRDKWWSDKADEVQGFADRHEDKEFYASLKDVYGPRHSTTVPLLASDNSTMITDKTEILKRWMEHFNNLLNTPSVISKEALDRVKTFPEDARLDRPPSLAEVRSAIKAMKNNKAPGPDAIPAEVFKHGGIALSQRLEILFKRLWSVGEVPQDFKDATIIPIYKRKGNKADCGNYRGISLLSIAGKILTRILLDRMLDTVSDQVIPEAQCGFRSGRGTTDMIFAARQLQEKCIEQHMDLYTVFVDLSKAFDSVSREGLWQLLRKFGCTENFTNILRSLHDGMLSRVSVDGSLSDAFKITNGVRQGCIAGPLLFNFFYAAMLDDVVRDLDFGVNIRFRSSGKLFNLSRLRSSSKVLEALIQELLYADDCALEAHSQQEMQRIVDKFADSAKNYGLTINIQKTEVMYQPAPGNPYHAPQVSIDGVNLKAVTDFCYLGSTVSNDNMLDKEISNRISKASVSFGRLTERVWKQRGISMQTKVKVYKAVVLTNLLYGCETWTCYRRHIKDLDKFHMRHLRLLHNIKWQNKITNTEVLQRSQCTGIEAMIISAQLRWTGHVARMDDSRIPKQLLYGELRNGKRSQGGQKKRYKDTLKHNLKVCSIDVDSWETLALDRSKWRTEIRNGTKQFESDRHSALAIKRQRRKQAQSQLAAESVNPSSGSFVCSQCGLICKSRIGLHSHSRRHRT
jgi:exonuclease III